ncbi:hypothetical protein LTR84_006043 [Exophiala bonariae]|uniref:Uncharacterized protein n=1 Tax=Exophiala bonariae TaxID=1690606 RepID=A0AAV9N5K1_9EURO|nr:hypothetical protein LTR84_006043 [Exophiala bonariae]
MGDKPQYLSFERSVDAATSDEALPLPQAIDDKYLSDEMGKNGKQPVGSPSTMEIFIATIKLHEILSQALSRDNCRWETTPDSLMGIQSLLRLDNLMHNWQDELPEYLQLDPSRENSVVDSAAVTHPQSAPFVQAAGRKLHIRHVSQDGITNSY